MISATVREARRKSLAALGSAAPFFPLSQRGTEGDLPGCATATCASSTDAKSPLAPLFQRGEQNLRRLRTVVTWLHLPEPRT